MTGKALAQIATLPFLWPCVLPACQSPRHAVAEEAGSAALRRRIDEAGRLLSASRFAEAKEAFESALLLARERNDRPAEAATLAGLADACRSLSDTVRARKNYQEAAALYRELVDRPAEARAWVNFGIVYPGEPPTREAFERALALFRELQDGAGEARALRGLGDASCSLGDPQKGRGFYENGLAVARVAGNRREEAEAFIGLGVVYQTSGDHLKAAEHLEKALGLFRELGERAAEARCLERLAEAYRELGYSQPARDSFERALALFRSGANGAGEARALRDLALIEMDTGKPDLARDLCERALALSRELRLRWLEERCGEDLAEIHRALADPAMALRVLEQALVRCRELGDRGEEAKVLENLGRACAAVGRPRDAKERFEESLALAREVGNRGLELAALADLTEVCGRIGEAAQGEEAHARLSSLLRQPPLDRNLLEGIWEHHGGRAAGAASAPAVIPGAIRGVLPKDACFLEYVEGEDRLHAYLVTEGTSALLDLGPREKIGTAADKYLRSLVSLVEARSERSIAAHGRALYQSLLAPALARAGGGVERLVIVPTASLAALPFEALVIGSKGGVEPRSFADVEFVIDRYEVSYALSSPVLLELAAVGARREKGKVLAMADPLYAGEREGARSRPETVGDARGAGSAFHGLERLRKTREETLALARMLCDPKDPGSAAALAELSGRRSGSFSTPTLDLFLGEEASTRRLEGDLRPYSLIHLACHGWMDRESPRRSGLSLSSSAAGEGAFTYADALELDLDADLVVLSGADTARGEARAGEGVESMARAFLYAGARAVVASLLPVEDPTAAETMEAFYEGLIRRQLGPSVALREAKLSVRRGTEARRVAGPKGSDSLQSGHPFFWAPFIYIGLPR